MSSNGRSAVESKSNRSCNHRLTVRIRFVDRSRLADTLAILAAVCLVVVVVVVGRCCVEAHMNSRNVHRSTQSAAPRPPPCPDRPGPARLRRRRPTRRRQQPAEAAALTAARAAADRVESDRSISGAEVNFVARRPAGRTSDGDISVH